MTCNTIVTTNVDLLIWSITTTREPLNAQLQWQLSHADFIQAKTAVKINESTYYKNIGQLQL